MELQHRDQGVCELTPVSTPTLAANSRFTARREDPHGEPRMGLGVGQTFERITDCSPRRKFRLL